MARHPALGLLLAASLMAGAALGAEEGDVVGSWYVDVEAYRGDLERALDEQFSEMPEAARAQMKAMMQGQIVQMFEAAEAHVDFRPDGGMVFYSAEEPPTPGTWSLDGDEIRFARATRVEGEPGYAGTVNGDVIRVEPDREMAMSVPLTLRRR